MKELKDLVAGDEVFYFNGYHHVEKVERITEKFLIVNGEKFNNKNGERRKNGCYSAINVPKDGEIEEFRKEQADRKLRIEIANADLCNLPIEKLRQIKAIIDQP